VIAAEERFAEKSRTHDTVCLPRYCQAVVDLPWIIIISFGYHPRLIPWLLAFTSSCLCAARTPLLYDRSTTINAVRGTALGRAALGGLGESSNHQDYQGTWNYYILTVLSHFHFSDQLLLKWHPKRKFVSMGCARPYPTCYLFRKKSCPISKSCAPASNETIWPGVQVETCAIWRCMCVKPLFSCCSRMS
jgi:hypothetical protein